MTLIEFLASSHWKTFDPFRGCESAHTHRLTSETMAWLATNRFLPRPVSSKHFQHKLEEIAAHTHTRVCCVKPLASFDDHQADRVTIRFFAWKRSSYTPRRLILSTDWRLIQFLFIPKGKTLVTLSMWWTKSHWGLRPRSNFMVDHVSLSLFSPSSWISFRKK